MPRRQVGERSALAFDLKADRKKHKISQVEAAKILCVTQPTVARWEQSGQMPHVYRLIWNMHWKQTEESTSESKEHSNVKNSGAAAGRNRPANVVDLRARKDVGRQRDDAATVTSRSGSNSGSTARRKSRSISNPEDNGLRVIEDDEVYAAADPFHRDG